MPHAAWPPGVLRYTAGVAVSACLSLALALAVPRPAAAASLTAKDAIILVKVLGFLEPVPAGGIVAVLYGPSASSKADAADIAGLFGDGLASRGGMVTARPVDAAGLGDGAGYIAVIVAQGGSAETAMAAAKARKILCVTESLADVQAGHCIMSVHAEPRVVITVNRTVAQTVGVQFAAAFAMLIHEI